MLIKPPPSDSDLDGDTQILATLLKHIPECIDAADIELLLQGIPVQPLLSDERMAGRQHYGFKLSTNADRDKVLGGDANGSVSFELAQIRVGPGTVPISIIIYIDATYIKHGIPIRPIYSELYAIKFDIIFIVDDILYDIVYSICVCV